EASATQAAQQAAGDQPTGQPLAVQQAAVSAGQSLTGAPLTAAAESTVTAALSALCHLQLPVPVAPPS
ncbi:MAG: hypothetical protein JWQ18_2037, partial [Conexibacter sp.]|nr:hypothetical protein [Conexibacter sp.]